ncbi:unannotated protein [freshwater metagenome]|uniref:Unannotated protein n=1 Tax=freshwater metagenome TaxID=449393 RepID=A0A6J6TBW4_9ZZZZ
MTGVVSVRFILFISHFLALGEQISGQVIPNERWSQ